MPIPDNPQTRQEMYLNAMATGDSSGIPESPQTREEMYLDAIVKNGSGGGGGSSTLSGLTDVDISNPTNGQTLVYNGASGKWENGASGGGGSGDSAFQTLGTVSDTKTGLPNGRSEYELSFLTQVSSGAWASPCAVRNCIISVDGVSTNVPLIPSYGLVGVNAPDYLVGCSVEMSDEDGYYCVIFNGTSANAQSREITVSVSFELYSYSDEFLALYN